MKRYTFIFISFIMALGINLLLHQFDNKYQYNDIEAVCGIVDYTSSSKLHFLTRQWEFYDDQLLTPDTIKEGQLTRYIDIGQFGGFDLGIKEKSPHGQATYRLRVFDTPDKVVTLQLPEIYSAYHLYVNGQLLYSSGVVEKNNYEARILSTDITFTTHTMNEIIIQVSDYQHYYSGMIYPMAYGTNQQINIYETMQTLIKGLQSFLPLVMCIICIMTYMFNGRDKRDLFLSFVCLSYLGYVLYGIAHLLMVSQSFLWYRLEDVCYYLLILSVTLLMMHHYQYNIKGKYFIIACILLILSLVIPTFFITTNDMWIYILSRMGKLYKIFFTLLIMYIIYIHGSKKKDVFSRMLLFATLFFVVSMNMDNVFWYEPILLGWGTEIAGFILISLFAMNTVSEKIKMYQQYHALTKQQTQMKEYIYDVAHDLKAPTASINGYIELLNNGIAKKLNKEEYLLSQMANKIEVLSKRVTLLQSLDVDIDMKLHNDEVGMTELFQSIIEKYEGLLVDKKIRVDIIGKGYDIVVDKEKFTICIENLLINAIEYSDEESTIIIELIETQTTYQFNITNQGVEISEEDRVLIFDRHFTTGDSQHSGLGLAICKKILHAHIGEIDVESSHHQTTFKVTLYKK